MQIEYYIKKGIHEPQCPNGHGVLFHACRVGGSYCKGCQHFSREDIKDGKMFIECDYAMADS